MDNNLVKIEQEVNSLTAKITQLKQEIGKIIIGQEETVEQLLITFLAGGHALLEGVPGLAKTLMIRTLAQAIDLKFKRIQFTPDLMPSDIIGTEILEEDQTTGKKFFEFNKGPIFSNIILADEINRTPPKTQAALLEAMQEFEVTYSGKTYALDKPFFILATQNPIEQSGTFPLPEAQQDRFLLYIRIGYPTEAEETTILKATTSSKKAKVESVLSGQEIIRLQQLVREVPISDELISKVSKIIRATRPETTSDEYVKQWVSWGAGPRAGQAMILTAKARALSQGRLSVTPDDLKFVAFPVLRHRVIVNFKAEAANITTDTVTQKLLETIL
ncbi:MAG TPA: AAA family ATPase [Leeuwenhoekiella sp.]|uniref:AAA family ATPase n=1 Tax=Leeuwenhoekiella palythoae TaxID=573501 RepID=UPI000E8C5CC2|nr:MoxR family ATPase [Leeuwenhoekiella palythoae]UBZ09657.1 MoxR family ATPase [Leeuwenhoekiella palythoae]HAX14565.1 AAA family ATPase [Leeuwenhoekiella sp.]HBO29090.1 AAA family ATPase [Leeuwenhoekiella sp.]HCQ75776.1 AAA family ATPase [Leeuwenhoekiella sp.]|tara:strand:- start:45383 stop:46375 length:993 start_codon:yes stop_codon:yes gene_type:complete